MAKTCVGIDIGSSSIKFALCSGGAVKRLAAVQLPENMVRDGMVISPVAMSTAIRGAAKTAGIPLKDCAVSLPDAQSFFQRVKMPAMTVEQMKINLPYEFRDYITKDKDSYFYDYSLVSLEKSEDGSPVSLDIMAAAAEKSTVQEYSAMMRRAGGRLSGAAPEEFAYSNIIRHYERRHPQEERREYCIIDLGHHVTWVHIFTGPNYETSRAIEFSGAMIDAAIAEQYNISSHQAQTYKLSNHENVLSLDACNMIYQRIAVEVMRAMNFYGFNNHQSALTDVYLCGGSALVEPLRAQLSETLEASVHSISELIEYDGPDKDTLLLYPIAIGTAMILGGC